MKARRFIIRTKTDPNFKIYETLKAIGLFAGIGVAGVMIIVGLIQGVPGGGAFLY